MFTLGISADFPLLIGCGGSSFLSEKSRRPLADRLVRRERPFPFEWGEDSQSLELDDTEEARFRPCTLTGGAAATLLFLLPGGRDLGTAAGDLERDRDEEPDQSL